jgi:two-component system, chemotaxis family, chemotaxis protein CheY
VAFASNRILIVDDYSTMRRVLTSMLHSIGCREVDSASDGPQALAQLRQRHYCLVICDLHMEPMSGAEVARLARANPATANVPFMMISADSKAETRVLIDGLKIEAFLLKPFTATQLQSCITRAVATAPFLLTA